MNTKLTGFFIGLAGLTATFCAGKALGAIEIKQPMTAEQCDKQAEKQWREFDLKYGYNLTDAQRREKLQIEPARIGCVERSKQKLALTVLGINL